MKHHVTAILKALKVATRTEAILAMAARHQRLQGATTPPKEDDTRTPIQSLPSNDKPSIVVMPFVNLSAETGNDYFADGMVEDITVALGRCSWLFVIASSSAFAYKGRTVDVRQVASDLGVRYVVNGSVRKADQRVRIVVQLSDGSDGVQIWADRFEGSLDAIFDIQDQVATQVAGMVAPALRSFEMQRAQRKPTDNLTAYDLFLRALQHIHRGEQANREALRLLSEAIELDDSYGAAYGLAAWCYRLRKVHGWVAPSDPSLAEGIRLAHMAAATSRRDSEGLWMAANALAHLSGELDLGLTMIEESLSLTQTLLVLGGRVECFTRFSAMIPPLWRTLSALIALILLIANPIYIGSQWPMPTSSLAATPTLSVPPIEAWANRRQPLLRCASNRYVRPARAYRRRTPMG